MKKTILVVLAFCIALTGCGQPLTVNKKEYPTYGLFNEYTKKSKNVCYEISVGNVILSIILIETIIAPIYFIGWDLFNPVRLKKDASDQCTIDS